MNYLKPEILLLIALILFSGSSVSWWNQSWEYRRPINITNTYGSDISNFPASIKLNTSSLIQNGKIQGDCDDIRIVENGSVNEYNLEKCNSTDTRIHFSTDVASVSEEKDTFIYYGNSSVEGSERRIPTRIRNGDGDFGNMSYWCSNIQEGVSNGYGLDSFYAGTACDGVSQSDRGSDRSTEYTGYDGLSRSGEGDWDVGPVSGAPTLGEGEDRDNLDGSDDGNKGFSGWLAYSGKRGHNQGLKGVKIPGGVHAHAWFHIDTRSGVDGDHCPYNVFVGTEEETSCGNEERRIAGWFYGDGNAGPSGDYFETGMKLEDQTSSNTDWTKSHTFDPKDGEHLYPYAMAIHSGGGDDGIVQIDDFYWSDSNGNPLQLQTEVGKEEKSSICDRRGSRNECIIDSRKEVSGKDSDLTNIFETKKTAVIESYRAEAHISVSNSSFVSGLWTGYIDFSASEITLRPGASFTPENRIILNETG